MKGEARETFRRIMKLLQKHLSIRLHHNANYTQEELFRLLVHAAMRNISVEEASAQQNILAEAPSADAVQYHFEKKDAKLLEREMDSLLQENVEALKKQRTLRIPRDIAIDFHNVPWYGKPMPWVTGGKHERGTSYFVEFATLEIVEKGERLAIKAVPVTQFDKREAIVKELLQFAEKVGIRIRTLYLDRAFPSFKVVKVLESARIKWVAAFSKNDKVKAIIKDVHLNGGFVRSYEMEKRKKKVRFTLVIVEKERDEIKEGVTKATELYSVFATNFEVPEGKRREIADWYRKRWGIETGYRVKKEFKIRTSTTSYSLKVLFFFLSVAMYNLWVLLNLAYALARNAGIEEPVITTDRLKFYYDWMVFKPEDFSCEESYRGLHLQWIKEGLISSKIEGFV